MIVQVIFNFVSGARARSQIRIIELFEPRILQTKQKVRITDAEDRSSGIETMTTLSDSDSMVNMEIPYCEFCVLKWSKHIFLLELGDTFIRIIN